MASAEIEGLLESLRERNVRCCHWKSNDRLTQALSGEGDLDLLVARRDRSAFERIVLEYGYKQAKRVEAAPIEHYFAIDTSTQRLIHLHVYFALITGGSLLKNHHFQVEDYVLLHLDNREIVATPSAAVDLALLVTRKALEHSSLLELTVLLRESELVSKELDYLCRVTTLERAAVAAREMFPELETDIFLAFGRALKLRGVSLKNHYHARKVARALRNLRVRNSFQAAVARITTALRIIAHRSLGYRMKKTLVCGGATVAFVGPDSVGKSTIARAVSAVLSTDLRVRRLHGGLPPATILTALPHALLPLFRRVAPNARSGEVRRATSEGHDVGPTGLRLLLYALRCGMLAYERRELIRRAFRYAARGDIVIMDRFPTATLGAMDSSQLRIPAGGGLVARLVAWIAAKEHANYRQIPSPNILIRITLPVDMAVTRNSDRQKVGKEDAEYIRIRHRHANSMEVAWADAAVISSAGVLRETIADALEIVWREL